MFDSLKQSPVLVCVAVVIIVVAFVIIGLVVGTYVSAQDGWEIIGMIITFSPIAIVVGAGVCVMMVIRYSEMNRYHALLVASCEDDKALENQ